MSEHRERRPGHERASASEPLVMGPGGGAPEQEEARS
jgi:hypothetical protein